MVTLTFNFNCLETGTTARKYPERPHHLDELCQLLSGRRPTHGVRYVSPLETSVRKYHIQRDLTTLMNSAHDFSQADLEYVTFLRSWLQWGISIQRNLSTLMNSADFSQADPEYVTFLRSWLQLEEVSKETSTPWWTLPTSLRPT